MKQDNLPQHIAITPDGNRRWAKKRRSEPWKGHFKGAENTEDLLQAAFDLGIRYFSFWGGSLSNLTNRPKREVKFLFKVYEQYFNKLLKGKEVHKNEVQVNVFGRWEEILPPKLVKTIKELIKKTEGYNKYFLNVFLAYSGTDEMLEGIKSILKNHKNGKINEELLRKNIWTGGLPPVDLLIRTGSNEDPHNSAGFMMWNCADTQFYFSKELYPDFGRKEFIEAIKDYQRRQRRFGV